LNSRIIYDDHDDRDDVDDVDDDEDEQLIHGHKKRGRLHPSAIPSAYKAEENQENITMDMLSHL
jgi:hypothetical protein